MRIYNTIPITITLKIKGMYKSKKYIQDVFDGNDITLMNKIKDLNGGTCPDGPSSLFQPWAC